MSWLYSRALVAEYLAGTCSDAIDNYLALAGLPKRTTPIAAERAVAREEALQRQREAQIAELRAARARLSANHAAAGQPEPKWRTTEAKRREIERVRREIEERKKP